MKTLALHNLKGGVGKTAAAVNLAYLAAEYGHRTLLWDLDAQGASTWYFTGDMAHKGTTKRLIKGKLPPGECVVPSGYERLDLLPAHLSNRQLDVLLDPSHYDAGRLAELIEPFSETYSLVVLDCPPSLSHLSENVFRAADIVLSPLIPTPLSIRAYEQVVGFLAKHKIRELKLYPFLSMVDRRRALHRRLLEELPREIKTLLKTDIPYASAVEQMGLRKAPLPTFDATGPAARAYESLWREVEALLGLA